MRRVVTRKEKDRSGESQTSMWQTGPGSQPAPCILPCLVVNLVLDCVGHFAVLFASVGFIQGFWSLATKSPHFTDEQTETPSGKVTQPGSHS